MWNMKCEILYIFYLFSSGEFFFVIKIDRLIVSVKVDEIVGFKISIKFLLSNAWALKAYRLKIPAPKM